VCSDRRGVRNDGVNLAGDGIADRRECGLTDGGFRVCEGDHSDIEEIRAIAVTDRCLLGHRFYLSVRTTHIISTIIKKVFLIIRSKTWRE
jgi:hypothetical protein